MKRILHALAALWPVKTGDRSWKTEDRLKTEEDRSRETEERSRKAEDRWKTEERRREHEGPWLPEARNGLLYHLNAMMRMGETVRELATGECVHLPCHEFAKEQPSEPVHLQASEPAPKKTDNQLPKRMIVSEHEQPAERIGEPLPIAQVLARLYLRHAPRCAMDDTGIKAVPAKQASSASSDSSKSNSQSLSLAPRRTVPLVLGVLALFMCLLSAQQVSAQAEPAVAAVKPLQIGDAIPEELWHLPLQVVNQPPAGGKETITLNDYRGKLIILDFWATWCAPCISSMYKLDTLQSQFSGDLAVIPTTYEQPEKVEPFFAEKGWALPTATMETTLKDYFPHQSIPHQVWVKDGKLLAVAGHEYANEQYINRVVQGEHVDFNHKIEVPFDKSKPLFLNGNGGDGSNMLYQSVISGRLNARVGGFTRPEPNQILAYNQTAEQLFVIALHYLAPHHAAYVRNFIMYEIDDSLKHKISPLGIATSNDRAEQEKWMDDNAYCYNLVLPAKHHYSDIRKRMLADLNDFFCAHLNVQAAYETRKRDVLALVLTESKPAILTKGEHGFRRVNRENQFLLTLGNKPIAELVHYLNVNLVSCGRPVVDQTGIAGNIDLEIDLAHDDFGALRSALQKHGLDLIPKTCLIKTIIFKYCT